ncbi:conserved hypothetical protein [Gammaproteobacteria bacterium]
MLPKKNIDVENKLSSIAISCKNVIDAIPKTTAQQQQESYDDVQKQKFEFIKLLYDYREQGSITPEDTYSYMEVLIGITYGLDKIASRQNFGITKQPAELPKDCVTIDQLQREEGSVVSSANEGGWARLQNGTKVFYKNTKPEIAQLEILAAEFFRHTLGFSHTSHGKIVVSGKEIKGMYVEAIPGFISIRQLTDLAEGPNAYEKIKAKIEELNKDINLIQKKIATEDKGDADAIQLITKLQEKIKLRSVYIQVREEHLIDEGRKLIDVEKISGIVAKALCSAFYYEDWDRHKDNFGIGYKSEGGLGVASLDYDKSLTGTFQQDSKVYDWTITSEKLRDFPDFDCWYWPTQSNTVRKGMASVFTSVKAPKMYSAEEANQYSRLKDDPKFQRQSRIEWLKLIFIPVDLHQLAVQNLTSPSCDPRLRNIHNSLEVKRQSLLNAAIQLNKFRKMFDNGLLQKEILTEVKKELGKNLNPEELLIVNGAWDGILHDIIAKANQVTLCEEIAKDLGYDQLLAAIERTGISFSPNKVGAEFSQKLKNILTLTSRQSSKNLCDKLNSEFGLSISEKDASAIKQEIYIKEISKNVPELARVLAENLQRGDIKKIYTKTGATYDGIIKLNLTLEQYKNSSPPNPSYLKHSVECLRNLGVSSEAIHDEELKTLINEDCHPVRPRSRRLAWQQEGQKDLTITTIESPRL